MKHGKTAFYIALFTLLVYVNSLGGSFIGDDKSFVVRNGFVHSPQNVAQFFADPSASAAGALKGDVYRPLTALSYALDYSIWKLSSCGYHLTNILLHAADSALVFFLIFLISGNYFTALITALLFSSHPVQTEAVTWISGRSNVLFLFFYLLSLIFYVRSARGEKRGVYPASVLCFLISLFSKEMAVTLPLIIIAYDMHFSGLRQLGRRILKYVPYFLAVLFFVAIRSQVLGKFAQHAGWIDRYGLFLTMLTVVVGYIRVMVFPLQLHAANYVVSVAVSFWESRVLVSAAVLAALAAAIPVFFRRSRFLSFFVCWFFITLLPVLNIVPIRTYQAERFLYLPSIGFCAVVASGLSLLNRKTLPRFPGKATAGMILAFIIIAAYSVRTVARNEDWKEEIPLYRAMVRSYPMSPWALNVLGGALLEAGEHEEALKILRRSVALKKDNAESRGGLGQCYLACGRFKEAAAELEEAVKLNPQNPVTRNTLGAAYMNMGRDDDAKKQFVISLKGSPELLGPALNLGHLEERKGKYREAIKIYAAMLGRVEKREETAAIFIRIGDAYAKMLQPARAKEYYGKARTLYGANPPEILTKMLDEKEKGL